MYKRFNLNKSDKTQEKAAQKHDEIYAGLDEMFSNLVDPIKESSKIDTSFFVDEIADNFLIHDSSFDFAKIDIWIEQTTLEVKIQISHNGADFNPLSDDSRCDNIKAAANRLTGSGQYEQEHSHVPKRYSLKYKLEKEALEE